MTEEVAYGQYAKSFEAIHSALSSLAAPPPGKKVTRLTFTKNPDKSIATIKFYDGAELLFTLAFTWDVDGTIAEVART